MSAAKPGEHSHSSEPLPERISRVFDRAKHEALAMILEAEPETRAPSQASTTGTTADPETQRLIDQHRLIAQKTYLTRKEAAIYLSVSERSIAEWSARAVEQNPFPEENAGSEPRYRRSRIDEWTVSEAQRQRLKLAG
jgi:hypothetical protein